MTHIIPYISKVPSEQSQPWIDALNIVLKNCLVMAVETMTTDQRLAARVAVMNTPDPDQLKTLPDLIWVQSLWAGIDAFLDHLPRSRFKFVRMTDPKLASTMAEAVLAWTLYIHRDMPRYGAQQRKRIWSEIEMVAAADRNVGILGFGKLGKAAAERLVYMGFNVSAWARTPSDCDGVDVLTGKGGLNQLLEQCHILVVLLPLTDDTRGLLNTHTLSKLPKNAAVINFARGPIINTDDLVQLLDDHHLSHAVLDVFDREPLADDSPLWDHLGVTVLPHISAPTTLNTAVAMTAFNINRYYETGEIPESIDPVRGY